MSSFGTTQSGGEARLYTMTNERGTSATVTSYGATLVKMMVHDREGTLEDVILGHDDVSGYQSEANQYFGCTTGRVANRIKAGQFVVNGREYQVAVNNGPNHLHGGVERSLDKVLWDAEARTGRGYSSVRFMYTSPNGEEGYPGNLDLTVTYTLTSDDELRIEYEATTDQDTPVNLTNHAYWNLAGAGAATVLDHELTLHCDSYTPTDDTLIPTGVIHPVEETPLDFRTPHVIGDRIGELTDTAALGYDHNFVVRGQNGTLRPAARLRHPSSGRVLEIDTTEPGIQFYSGNFLKGDPGKGGLAYPKNSALCLEAQHYPDSVNQPAFPTVILAPGQTYHQTTVHRFSVD